MSDREHVAEQMRAGELARFAAVLGLDEASLSEIDPWDALYADIVDLMVREQWGTPGDTLKEILARHRAAIEREV